jgi:glucose-1-phosphatase
MLNLSDKEAIIFDLGGVIINLNYQATIDAFIALGLKEESFYSQANQTELFDAYETGMISSQHFINKLLPFLRPGTTANQVVHAWNKMILDFPIERLNLLEQLQSKYRIFLLSNTNAIHIDCVLRQLRKVTEKSLHSYFEKVYLSHEIQLRKPSPDVFEFVCQQNKLNAQKCLFIDDSIQHIEGAKKVGLDAYHLKPGEEIQFLFS